MNNFYFLYIQYINDLWQRRSKSFLIKEIFTIETAKKVLKQAKYLHDPTPKERIVEDMEKYKKQLKKFEEV